MEGMILRLTDIKSRLREPEHANKAEAEWMKSVKYHTCGKKGHIMKFCRTPKKDWVKKDEKNEGQASVDEKSKKKPKIQQQHAKIAQELDLDSKSNKSVALAVEAEAEAEAAMLANEKPSSWLINSRATSHVTGDRSIFTSFTPYSGGKLKGVGGSPKILGRGDAVIGLLNNSTAELRGISMVPGTETHLLSTQVLRWDKGIVGLQELSIV